MGAGVIYTPPGDGDGYRGVHRRLLPPYPRTTAESFKKKNDRAERITAWKRRATYPLPYMPFFVGTRDVCRAVMREHPCVCAEMVADVRRAPLAYVRLQQHRSEHGS